MRVTRFSAISLVIFLVLTSAPLVLGAQEANPYRVGPKDVLNITVFGRTELSGKFSVDGDGTFLFPLLGPIKAGEHTVQEIQTELKTRLEDGYLKNPQINVQVLEFLSQRVFVIGEVRTPGPIAISGNTTLLDALAHAGSLTEQAGGEVFLLRPGSEHQMSGASAPGQPGVTELGRISVQQLRNGTISANVSLRDGDTIFVPRAERISIIGNVKNPGSYAFEPGLTALRAVMYLAGGPTEVGSTGRLQVTRVIDGKEIMQKAKPEELLKPGDIVVVGTRLF